MGARPTPLLPEDRRGPPILSNGKGDLLCADVRLDDRNALGAAIGLRTGELATLSDPALILRAFERWGPDAIARLYGDFALAFWDAAKRHLILARDCSAQKPLFFHRSDKNLAWASMPSGLQALPDVPAEADVSKLASFLRLAPELDDGSFFKGISKVEPGHYLTFTASGMRKEKYWTPSAAPLLFKRDEEYVEALRERIDAAVASRLRGADGKAGAHLSSGLDSGTVAATAARILGLTGGELFAFTAVPREGFVGPRANREIADEGMLAGEVAGRFGNIRHRLVRTGGQSPLDHRDEDFELFQRPILNPVNFVWIKTILNQARECGVGVLLTGARGNMSFSYSGMSRLPQLLRSGALPTFAREARALAQRGSGMRGLAWQSLSPFIPNWGWRASVALVERAMGWENRNFLGAGQQRRGDMDYRPRFDSVAVRVRALGGVDYGNYNKGMLAGWGVDVRDPTSDRRLVEFCLRVPEEQYLRGGVTRSLARRAMADRLPPSILDEKRKGYQAADWYEGLAGEQARLAAEVERLRAAPDMAAILDVAALDELVANWPVSGWDDPKLRRSHRLGLLRALSAAHFARAAEAKRRKSS